MLKMPKKYARSRAFGRLNHSLERPRQPHGKVSANRTARVFVRVRDLEQVRVMWIGTWGDERIETWAARKLWVEDGCRVITQHSDTAAPQIVFHDNGPPLCAAADDASAADGDDAAQNDVEDACLSASEAAAVAAWPAHGVGIGYNSDMRQIVGDSVLTSVRITWAPALEAFVSSLLRGMWATDPATGLALDTWPGVSEAPTINDLSPLSSRVSFATTLLVDEALAEMRAGTAPRVFCGALRDSDGVAVNASLFLDIETGAPCGAARVAADDVDCCLGDWPGLLDMTWLIEGVAYPATTTTSGTKWGTFNGAYYTPPPRVDGCDMGTAWNTSSHGCELCAAGTSATAGAAHCTPCVRGEFAPEAGMASCIRCDEGYFADFRGATGCRACPSGARCTGGREVLVSDGYWRATSDSLRVTACPFGAAACIGGNGSADALCAPGYEGPKCAVCSHGSYYAEMRCARCRGDEEVAVGVGAVAIGVALTAAAVVHMIGLGATFAARAAQWRAWFERVVRRRLSLGIVDVAKLKTIWVTLQIVASMPWTLSIEWPWPFGQFVDVLAFMELDLKMYMPLGCLNWGVPLDFLTLALIALIAPVLLVGAIVTVGAVRSHRAATAAASKVAMKGHESWPPARSDPNTIAAQHANAALLVLFVCYPTTSTAMFRVFQCEAFDDGTSALVADLSITCGAPRHAAHEVMASLGIALVAVGVPLGFALLLGCHRKRLDPLRPPAAMTRWCGDCSGDGSRKRDGAPRNGGGGDGEYSLVRALRKRAADRGLRPFAVLWQPYEPAYYWIEPLECARRILLTGGLTFVGSSAHPSPGVKSQRAAFGFAVSLLSLVCYREVRLIV